MGLLDNANAYTQSLGRFRNGSGPTQGQQQNFYDNTTGPNKGAANLGQAMGSHAFQASKDYAQRIAGVNPEESMQGASYYTMGGRSFKNTRGADLGTYEGDTGVFSGDIQNFLKKQEELAKLGPLQTGVAQRGQHAGPLAELTQQYGNHKQQDLIDRFQTMTGAQRDQVIQQTGLTVDQLIEFQAKDSDKRARNNQFEVQNYNSGEIDRSAERMLQESIQQRQTSNGLYQSQASAAGEGNAMALLQAGRMRDVTPTLMLGTLDPNKLNQKDHQVDLQGTSFNSHQLLWGNKPPGRGTGSAESWKTNPGNPGGRDLTPAQRYRGGGVGAFGGTIDYNQVNMLGSNSKDPFALMYGVGSGGFFGG